MKGKGKTSRVWKTGLDNFTPIENFATQKKPPVPAGNILGSNPPPPTPPTWRLPTPFSPPPPPAKSTN
jgi:hypothetical protein